MPKQLQTQIENTAEVRNVLKRLDYNITLADGTVANTFLIYLPCKDDLCDTSELLKLIKDVLYVNFSLRISNIESKFNHSVGEERKNKLFREALTKISTHTAHGELGELLLFTLLESYFDAPKILTKMSLKTNPNIPYHGADAIHAQFVGDKLRLYFGESKLYADFSDARTSAINSISKGFDDATYKAELLTVMDNIDFPNIDDEVKSLILELIDPFSETHNKEEMLQTPCFIGFTDPDVFSSDPEAYANNYIKKANKRVSSFYRSLMTKGISPEKVPLLLLPFSCINSFVDEFINYLGIAP